MTDKGNAILVEKTWGGGLAGPLGPLPGSLVAPEQWGEPQGEGPWTGVSSTCL